MASDEAPVPLIEIRPTWGKVCVATLAGVVGGGLFFLALQWPLTLLLDLLFGRSGWQGSLGDWPRLLQLCLQILYWTFPLALGQFFSILMSGWTKTVYFAAGLQSIHLINIYGDFAFAAVWLLPWVIASAMIMAKWAAVGAEKGRALEAKRIAAQGKH